MTLASKTRNSKRNLHLGNVEHWEKTDFGISGKTSNGFFKITVFEHDTIRIQASQEDTFFSNPYSVVSQPRHEGFSIEELDQLLVIKTKTVELKLFLNPFHLKFYDKNGKLLNEDDPSFSISWLGTEVTNYKKLQPQEKFVGLGEKTGNLNRAGKAYTNWNTDYFAYGIGDDPLYMSIPFYIGIHDEVAYGIFFDNTHKSVFNFGASNNRFMYFSAEDGEIDYYFMHDDHVSKILSAYTKLTGRMEMPPMWSLGFQQCRYSYYPESEVLNLAQTFREKDMPADVIYLDIHHMEKYKVFTFDNEKFTNPKAMITKLKEKGFKVVVIMDPGIKTEAHYAPYVEGLGKDLFVKYPDGEIYEGQVWPGWCAFPDFTKEETRTWWGEKMKFYKDAGVDGYWTDMNEPASWGQHTPNLIDFHYEGEIVSHRKARNIYGMQMAKAAKEGSEMQAPNQRPFVLTRSGFSGIQRYAAAWTGDNVSSEEHMLAGVRLVNSLGLSGVSFSGYDIGGFAGEASKSLFARWISIATFSPFYRAHSMINSCDSEPWSFGEEVEEISRNYMKLRYQMLPTLYSHFYKSTESGLPVAKSLVLDFPHEAKVYEEAFQNQYIFCESLLIAPIESTKEITKVYLPEGDWYYFFNDQKYSGNQIIYVDTPLSYLPVFAKAGSIIAMQSAISHTDATHEGVLKLHIYKGKGSSTYLHYEDDGFSKNYQKAEFFKREITWNSDKQELQFGPVEGNYESAFKEVQLYFHGIDKDSISLGDQEIKGEKENLAFLGRLTEFDPLPDYSQPYYEVENINSFRFTHQSDEFKVKI
ncbi:family 31 glycosyl hydrolase, alpha-glucosidase [Belliella baltica DSM 15883]|uniref:Family 31 glycosyl hydrolase, alpha-glucosidase n=1 Tax=Belliella baltica (strain DSM 15883 / CIP 108006 / LMG 21964 / BA134) TaxID=866536 RepID=I3Z9D2_BELBD|nr:glycoside hydrolase family 31 protein [Belliella baltica]AFL85850.1 family 31 glycosyl hydrolase, alpha-glucosidase [Belliella baltica DSM 15883]